MGIDYDEPDAPILGLQVGVVTHNDDPKGIGRVRVRIPGLIEPAGPWALPLGVLGGGSKDRGIFWPPEVGSEVGILFVNGDPDAPRYLGGHWGAPGGSSDAPSAAGGDPDVRVLAFGAYDLVVDARASSKGFRIVDKAADDNVLEFDGNTRALKLSSTTAIRIESSGQVVIDGLVVMIKGIPAGFGQV